MLWKEPFCQGPSWDDVIMTRYQTKATHDLESTQRVFSMGASKPACEDSAIPHDNQYYKIIPNFRENIVFAIHTPLLFSALLLTFPPD